MDYNLIILRYFIIRSSYCIDDGFYFTRQSQRMRRRMAQLAKDICSTPSSSELL